MSARARERLLLVHSHIAEPDDSEWIELYPFMSKKERAKYQNGFQSSIAKTLKFPINESIPIRISPSVFTNTRWHHDPQNRSSDIIGEKLQLISKLVEDFTVLNFTDHQVSSKYLCHEMNTKEWQTEFENTDTFVLLVEELNNRVLDFVKALNTGKTVIVVSLGTILLNLKADAVLQDDLLVLSPHASLDSGKFIPTSIDEDIDKDREPDQDLESQGLWEDDKRYYSAIP